MTNYPLKNCHEWLLFSYCIRISPVLEHLHRFPMFHALVKFGTIRNEQQITHFFWIIRNTRASIATAC